MAGRVEGKRALITGAASGLGRATALSLAAEGARVAVTDCDEVGARQVVVEIRAVGNDAIGLALDVTEALAWTAALEHISGLWGGLDILVASAGKGYGAPLTETPLEEWREVMAVNLDGVFLALKHGIPVLRRSVRKSDAVEHTGGLQDQS